MADERASGIMLRLRPLTETSLIIQWLTPEHGRISTVAKGARRPKSPFRGKLDLYFEADFSFARSRRSDLHTLREVTLLQSHADLRKEWTHLEQLAYASRLIEQTTETESPIPEIHALFCDMVRALENHKPHPLAIPAFELKLLELMGLQPDLEEKPMKSEAARILAQSLVSSDWTTLFQMATLVPRETLQDLDRFMHGYLIFHLDRIPKGRPSHPL